MKMIFRSRTIVILLLTLALCSTAFAKSTKSKHKAVPAAPVVSIPVNGTTPDAAMQAFERKFLPLMQKWRVPGASLTVMKIWPGDCQP